MEDINKVIGKNLLILRKRAKLTQVELADKFKYSDKTISKWETGESLPSIEILHELAQFYNVTLNDLVSKEPIPNETENKKSTNKPFPTKLVITLLAVSAVWLCATVLFVCFNIVLDVNYGMVFFWAVPVSCIVLIVFNSIWGKNKLLFPILTVLIWTTLACIHVQLIKYQLWVIYILGVPLQVAVTLWGALLTKKPNLQKTNKSAKIKKEKETKKELNQKETQQKESNTLTLNNVDKKEDTISVSLANKEQ